MAETSGISMKTGGWARSTHLGEITRKTRPATPVFTFYGKGDIYRYLTYLLLEMKLLNTYRKRIAD